MSNPEGEAGNSSQSRQAADLAAIKAREAGVRELIEARVSPVDVGPFNMLQLGLTVPVVDRHGNIWRLDGGTLTLIVEKGEAGHG